MGTLFGIAVGIAANAAYDLIKSTILKLRLN